MRKGAAPKRDPFRAGISLSIQFPSFPSHRRSYPRSVSVESEDWRLIGCIALRVGLHEGDGQLDLLGIEEVGDTMSYVLSNLTVQRVMSLFFLSSISGMS